MESANKPWSNLSDGLFIVIVVQLYIKVRRSFLNRHVRCLMFVILTLVIPTLLVPRANAANLVVTVQTDKAVYNPGDNVVIKVYVTRSGTPFSNASVYGGIEFPGGGTFVFSAPLPGPGGWYQYTFHLSPSAVGGVYKVTVTAISPISGDTSGSAQTTFAVRKTVDWAVYNPSITPANPTTQDPVTLNVQLKIVATTSTGPYPVDIVCSVDGVTVGGGTITVAMMTPVTVYTDPRKYSAGVHTATWVVDPNSDYNDPNIGNNQVSHQFQVTTPAPAFDFTLTASPPSQTVKAGGTATFTVTANLVSGSPSAVELSISGLPEGATSSFNPTKGAPSFSSTLTISTGVDAALGTYTLTITGAGGGLSKTANVTLTIQSPVEPAFEISAAPTSQTVTSPQSTSYIVSIAKKGDFKSTVDLTVSGLPAGVEASFNPQSGTPDYTSALTLTAAKTAPSGTYVLTIYASGGGKTKSTVVTLMVQAASTPTPSPEPTEKPFMEQYGLYIGIAVVIVIALAAALVLMKGRKPSVKPAPRGPAEQAPTQKFCVNCGTSLPADAQFCKKCGSKQT